MKNLTPNTQVKIMEFIRSRATTLESTLYEYIEDALIGRDLTHDERLPILLGIVDLLSPLETFLKLLKVEEGEHLVTFDISRYVGFVMSYIDAVCYDESWVINFELTDAIARKAVKFVEFEDDGVLVYPVFTKVQACVREELNRLYNPKGGK